VNNLSLSMYVLICLHSLLNICLIDRYRWMVSVLLYRSYCLCTLAVKGLERERERCRIMRRAATHTPETLGLTKIMIITDVADDDS